MGVKAGLHQEVAPQQEVVSLGGCSSSLQKLLPLEVSCAWPPRISLVMSIENESNKQFKLPGSKTTDSKTKDRVTIRGPKKSL